MSLLISFTLRKKHSTFICWSDTLTLHRREGGEPFYLSCRWTWVLLTGPGKETASGNGSLFKWHLSAFVLRQRSAYLSKRSDLRRLRCSIDHRPHPVVPDRVTRLQQHVKCMHAFFVLFFSTFHFVERLNLLLLCFNSDDWRCPHLLILPCVFSDTHWEHCYFKNQPCRGGDWMSLPKVCTKTSTTSADAH